MSSSTHRSVPYPSTMNSPICHCTPTDLSTHLLSHPAILALPSPTPLCIHSFPYSSVCSLLSYSPVFPVAHWPVHPLTHSSQTSSPSCALTTHPPPSVCSSIHSVSFSLLCYLPIFSVQLLLSLQVTPLSLHPPINSSITCLSKGPAIIAHRDLRLPFSTPDSSILLCSLYPNQEMSHQPHPCEDPGLGQEQQVPTQVGNDEVKGHSQAGAARW